MKIDQTVSSPKNSQPKQILLSSGSRPRRLCPSNHDGKKGYDELRQGMINIDTIWAVDWAQCELIEQVPGKVSGRPVVRGTRIMPDAIVGSYDLGETVAELHEGFPTLSIAQIERLIEFAHAQRERQLK